MTTNRDFRQPLIAPPEKTEKTDIERLCIDDMLQKYCGEFGKWQMKHFVLTCMAWALEAFHTMVMIFADKQPEFTCEPGFLECDVCGGEPGSWLWEEGGGGGGGVVSTVAEWGLVCGEKYKVGLVQALFFGGCMIDRSCICRNGRPSSTTYPDNQAHAGVVGIFFNGVHPETVPPPHEFSRWSNGRMKTECGLDLNLRNIGNRLSSSLPNTNRDLWPSCEDFPAGHPCHYYFHMSTPKRLPLDHNSVGAGIFGHLSDSKLGRKGSLIVVCILNAIFGLLTSFSPNYLTYVLLRILTGFSTGGVGLCAFVLATEPVGPSKRGMAGMSTFYFFSGGIALLSGIAYVFQTWRSLYIASSVPSIIFVLVIMPFISESPRWYLIRGQNDNAMKIMRAIAVTNGKYLPENVYVARDEEVNDNDQKSIEDRSKEVITGSIVDALKSPLTRIRLFLVVGINFTCSIVYYGLSLNVVNLETNLYINVLVNSIAELPAYFLTAVLIDRFGRKPLGVGTQWFSGIFCIAGSFMGSQGTWKVVRMLCGVLGIFGMAATYNLLFIYALELFPTVVRNAALGCATQAAQLGAILAPFVVVLGGGLPFMIFGVCGVVGGFLTFYLPETLNKPLYDTMNGMADGESEA